MNWIIVLVLLFPSFALAQDGSAPPQDAGSVPGASDGGSVPSPTDPVAPEKPTPAEDSAPASDPAGETPTPATPAASSPASSGSVTQPPTGNGSVPNPSPSAPAPTLIDAPQGLPSEEPLAVAQEGAPIEAEDEDTNPLLLPIIVALAVVPSGFLVAGALKKKKVKKGKK